MGRYSPRGNVGDPAGFAGIEAWPCAQQWGFTVGQNVPNGDRWVTAAGVGYKSCWSIESWCWGDGGGGAAGKIAEPNGGSALVAGTAAGSAFGFAPPGLCQGGVGDGGVMGLAVATGVGGWAACGAATGGVCSSGSAGAGAGLFLLRLVAYIDDELEELLLERRGLWAFSVGPCAVGVWSLDVAGC